MLWGLCLCDQWSACDALSIMLSQLGGFDVILCARGAWFCALRLIFHKLANARGRGNSGEHVAVMATTRLCRNPHIHEMKVSIVAPDFRFCLLFCQVHLVVSVVTAQQSIITQWHWVGPRVNELPGGAASRGGSGNRRIAVVALQ